MHGKAGVAAFFCLGVNGFYEAYCNDENEREMVNNRVREDICSREDIVAYLLDPLLSLLYQ